jgi:hypothetical protein
MRPYSRFPGFKTLLERQRPTFHGIQGLGSRLRLERGMTKEAISALMTHSSQQTMEIYLERERAALTDDDFHTVSAPFTLKELLGVEGSLSLYQHARASVPPIAAQPLRLRRGNFASFPLKTGAKRLPLVFAQCPANGGHWYISPPFLVRGHAASNILGAK